MPSSRDAKTYKVPLTEFSPTLSSDTLTSYLWKKFIFLIEEPTFIRASVLLLESHLLFHEQCQAVPSNPLSTSSIPTLVYYFHFLLKQFFFLAFSSNHFAA